MQPVMTILTRPPGPLRVRVLLKLGLVGISTMNCPSCDVTVCHSGPSGGEAVVIAAEARSMRASVSMANLGVGLRERPPATNTAVVSGAICPLGRSSIDEAQRTRP